jgi:MFS family permease
MKNPYISLAGCAVCGFAISTFWPGVVEVASRKFPEGSGAMYSAIAIFGDVGCSVAPFLTGVIASGYSLRAGMIINVIYPIAFIFLIMKLMKKGM